jgi:hypothetical protein
LIEQSAYPVISISNDSICAGTISSLEIEVLDTTSMDWFVMNSEYNDQDSAISITVQNQEGCIYSEDIYLFISSNISVFPIEQTINNQHLLSLNPSGGISPYTIQWGDSTFGEYYFLNSSEWISYEIIDDMGCNFVGSYYYQSTDEINEIYNKYFVYAEQDLLICLGFNNLEYSIIALNGGLVEKGMIENESINTATLKPGIYLLQLNSHVFRFVKY